MPTVVSTFDRPDLVPVVARWLWHAFWHQSGKPYETLLQSAQQASATPDAIPRSFVLLDGDQPLGTASFIANDLDERPDLTPWLAGVFVEPRARRQGYAGLLIAAVEDQARIAGFDKLWLYTREAERMYARAGWKRTEMIDHAGARYTLMHKVLSAAP